MLHCLGSLKKLLLIILLVSPFSLLANNGSGFVTKHGQLSVKGTSLVDSKGDAIMLRGVSLGWHNWWSRFYNKETVSWLSTDWNANLIRAAIGVEPDGAYLQNKELAFDCLTKVVDAAIAEDIYVIIDWHSHNILLDDAKEFFTKMATRYGKYPNVIYEIYNEPEKDSWEEIKTYAEEVIKTIRAIDSDNVILVGTPHWDQDVDIAANNPIMGVENVMYTLHFYAATHKQELRDKAQYALDKKLPLFVSECASMEATGDGPINKQEWNNWVQFMEKNKLSWVVWSIADKDETCSMIESTKSPSTGWSDKDLKEWGLLVKEILREKNKGTRK